MIFISVSQYAFVIHLYILQYRMEEMAKSLVVKKRRFVCVTVVYLYTYHC